MGPSRRNIVPTMSERSFSINQISITEGEDDFETIEENRRTSRKTKLSEDKVVRESSRRVRRAGHVLVGYLMVAALLCAAGVAWLLRRQEESDFDESFDTAVGTVTDALPRDFSRMLGTMRLFVLDIQSWSAELHLTWPYVTLSMFAPQAANLNTLLGTSQLTLLPVVHDREAWEVYANEHQNWIDGANPSPDIIPGQIQQAAEAVIGEDEEEIYLPSWQTFPVETGESVNVDWLSLASQAPTLRYVLANQKPAVSPLYKSSAQFQTPQWHSTLFYPIRGSDGTVVAILAGTFAWDAKVLINTPPTWRGFIDTFIYSTCDNADDNPQQSLLLTAEGTRVLENPKLSYNKQLALSMHQVLGHSPCQTLLDFSPVEDAIDDYYSITPLWGAIVCFAVLLIALTLYAFLLYRVGQRHLLVLRKSAKSNALVSSLFPSNIHDRLLENSRSILSHVPEETGDSEEHEEKADSNSSPKSNGTKETADSSLAERQNPPRLRLKSFLRESSTPVKSNHDSKPIADFFPNCTVMFADICGFTAWSSQRDPHQVFTLLQNLYAIFDRSAKKMGVFKVETIGDSYVAVTGLPDPQKNHAIIMARFAIECKSKMRDVTKKLVKSLGPETENLQMRFGLHSGPVTAGVLRGERSRFQLFGDTVNTAARMESCGMANRIQMSEVTADLLVAAGKGNMVTPRDESIEAKGKGTMRVYWLEENRSRSIHHFTRVNSLASTMSNSVISFGMFASSESLGSSLNLMKSTESLMQSSTDLGGNKHTLQLPDTPKGVPLQKTLESRPSLMWGSSSAILEPKLTKFRRNTTSSTNRLIEWNCGLLMRLLQQVVTKRQSSAPRSSPPILADEEDENLRKQLKHGHNMVEEVAEIISMPNYEPLLLGTAETQALLSLEVEHQLRNYVSAIATMYRDNPFHNYEHACHVQMSMSKLLERVVNPDSIDYESSEEIASDAHNFTYGLTSDPLTQFTVVFCALIHDVDHTGVSNSQLIKEGAHIASLYKNQSVAEQNSIDLAWDLLMSDDYKDLRKCIYTNESEFKRFRQLVVNTVLATDIFDKELSALRKNRWNKAFQQVAQEEESPTDAANRKATIVIEHLIQASDVSHTMQHWDIYRRWNERLFFELYLSYKDGRAETDPSIGWYKGELWFFDNYVIPLAKKLDDCGVFGVCSDECLVYAMENRKLWELYGEAIVQEMLSTDYYEKLKEKEDSQRPRRRARRKSRGLDLGELSTHQKKTDLDARGSHGSKRGLESVSEHKPPPPLSDDVEELLDEEK